MEIFGMLLNSGKPNQYEPYKEKENLCESQQTIDGRVNYRIYRKRSGRFSGLLILFLCIASGHLLFAQGTSNAEKKLIREQLADFDAFAAKAKQMKK